jgi:hypothetical protein
MITNNALKLIQEMADCTTKRDWEKLMTTTQDDIGGLVCTCSDKLLVLTLTREEAKELATEILDHRARIAYIMPEPLEVE